MKISIQGFLGIHNQQLTVDNVLLVAGLNGAGKSSIIESIRYAHTLSCDRNSNRTNKPLINQHAKGFQIIINDNVITNESKTPITTIDPDLVAVAMDGSIFANGAAKDRKKLTSRLFGIDISIDKVCKELAARDIEQSIIDMVKPYMKAGIENAETKAKSFASAYKSEWSGITNEKFGSIKSEKWQAVANQPNLLAIEDQIITGDVDEMVNQKDALKVTIQGYTNTIQEYRNEAAKTTPAHEPCPSCGTLLTRQNGKFVEVQQPDDHGDKTDATAKKIAKIERSLQTAQMDYAAISDALAKHYNAVTMLAGAEQQAIDEAANATRRAKEKYDLAMGWDAAAKALAPDQIPALFGSKLPSALNKALAHHSELAGFDTITADADLDLAINGIPYRLLSESQRWRVDAVIAVIFAEVSTLNFVAIDRLDVLAPQDRGGVLTWLARLDFPTLVAATLKQRPEKLPAPVECVWLHNDGSMDAAA